MATEVNARHPAKPVDATEDPPDAHDRMNDRGSRTGRDADDRGGRARDAGGRDAAGRDAAGRDADDGRGPGARLGALVDEAQAAVSSSANVLRDVRQRYRAAHHAEVKHWEGLRGELAHAAKDGRGQGTNDSRDLAARERDEAVAAQAVGVERATLARLELAIKSLENAWLFLDPTDETLVHDPSGPASAADAQMRIVEAEEAERNRLAREIHDGPAQALSNAIFEVELVERLLDRDEKAAREELQSLREMLTRELRGVRAWLSQLRPPALADLGLAGAIEDAAEQISSVLGLPVTVDVDERIDGLPETSEVAILRVVQEALQNARKHAAATSVSVKAAREAGGWVIEVRDDGKGFDLEHTGPDRTAVGSRRSFGLQFMRERAGLIGARFEVRSRPAQGTVVRMVIPANMEDTR